MQDVPISMCLYVCCIIICCVSIVYIRSKFLNLVLIVAFRITLCLFHSEHNAASMPSVHLGILFYKS